MGEGWFSDAMCVLADIVFYFVPEYLLGPRLVPMLITLLILAHMALPVFHAFSFYVVWSFFRIHVCPSYQEAARANAAPSGVHLTNHVCRQMFYSISVLSSSRL